MDTRLRKHKRNEEIREAATIQPITTHLMQKRLRWYGHVRRRHDSHMTRAVLDMVVEGVRPRGRPTLRYMDTIRRDIKKKGLTDVNIRDRKKLETGSFKGDPLKWKSLQGEKGENIIVHAVLSTVFHVADLFSDSCYYMYFLLFFPFKYY